MAKGAVAAAEGPKLASMKYLVEGIVHADDRATIMKVGDRADVGRSYALKVLKREGPDDDPALAAARGACDASSALKHAAILRYYDYRTRSSWFRVSKAELLMELVEGRSLDGLAEPVEVGQGLLLFGQLAAALAHMHRRGVCHGDLKPSHVMVARSGQVKTFGYGLSNVKPGGGAPRGSKLTMAPEQMRGDVVDEKTDLYNLGATMYQLLTGQPANVGRRAEGEGGKITIPAVLNGKIPTALNNLIVSCLQSQPAKRPDGASEVVRKVDDILRTTSVDEAALRPLARSAAGA